MDEARDLEVEELRAARTRVVAAADERRRSIERELHDGAMQQLIALVVDLQLASRLVDVDPVELKRLLDEMSGNVREALDDLRRLSWRVYPSLLLDRGLDEALRAAAAEAGLPTQVAVDTAGRLPPELEASIYFCCVELLQHAAEDGHGATVGVCKDGEHVVFDVTVVDADVELWATRDLTELGDRLGAFGGRLAVAPAPAPKRGVRISGQALCADRSSVSAR